MEENKVISIDEKIVEKINEKINNQTLTINSDEKQKIPVLDFITKYNGMTSDKAKEAYIKRVVRSDEYYVPYISKMVYANQILEIANFNKEGKVYFNGAKQYQLYIWTLLTLYTLLDVPSQGFEMVFDILNQKNLIDVLVEQMPNDKVEFDMVFRLSQEDFDRNYSEVKINTEEIIRIINKGLIDSLQIIVNEISNLSTKNIDLNISQENN